MRADLSLARSVNASRRSLNSSRLVEGRVVAVAGVVRQLPRGHHEKFKSSQLGVVQPVGALPRLKMSGTRELQRKLSAVTALALGAGHRLGDLLRRRGD